MQPSEVRRLDPPVTTMIRLRRGQLLVPSAEAKRAYHRVSSGLVALEISLGEDRRQILAFNRTGEGFTLSADMPLPALRVRAILPSTLLQCPVAAPQAGAESGPAKSDTAQQRIGALKLWLHTAVLGRLTAEERVATFMLEQAHSSTNQTSKDAHFLLPMTRQDIADYLGLNPDTLSRVLSRLQTSGTISIRGRSDVYVSDLKTLEAISPLADAMRQICSGDRASA